MPGSEDRRPSARTSPSGKAKAMPATVAATARWRPPQSSQPTPSGPAVITCRDATMPATSTSQTQRRTRVGRRRPPAKAMVNRATRPMVRIAGTGVRVNDRTTTTPRTAGQNRCSAAAARRGHPESSPSEPAADAVVAARAVRPAPPAPSPGVAADRRALATASAPAVSPSVAARMYADTHRRQSWSAGKSPTMNRRRKTRTIAQSAVTNTQRDKRNDGPSGDDAEDDGEDDVERARKQVQAYPLARRDVTSRRLRLRDGCYRFG